MFFSEYLINSTEFILYDQNNNRIHDLEFVSEIMQPQINQKMQPQQQQNFNQFNPASPEPQLNPSAEFENIKLYVLYSRFKEFRQYLQDLNINIQNPEVDSIIEFLDIILLFYTSFSYSDLTTFLDSITASLEEKLKIKLPKRIYSDPAIDGQI
jgi:hypothetical protein